MSTLTGDTKYYSMLAKKARGQHSAHYAKGYRDHDERGALESWPTHLDLGDFLETASGQMNRPLDVLDLACGCGRYFHRIQQVKNLTGVDLSPDMLEQAKHPVNEEKLQFPITLVCQNIAALELPQYDFVYAIGIYGVCLPLDAYLLGSALSCVRPGGRLAFSVTDSASQKAKTWKRQLAQWLAPFLPRLIRRWIQTRLFLFGIKESELREALAGLTYTVQYRQTPSGLKEFLCVVDP